MKRCVTLIACVVSVILIAGALTASAVDQASSKAALTRFSADFPQTGLYWQEDRITAVYGSQFGSGASPEDAADRFVQTYSPLFSVSPGDLRPESILDDGRHTQPVMYESDKGAYKFTLVYYSQYKDGIPVYKADLRLLVRNESGYPLVQASSALRNLGEYAVDPAAASIDPLTVQQSFRATVPNLVIFSQPRMVIWAGIDDMKVTPSLGVEFKATNGTPATEGYLFIVDPVTLKTLYQENLIIDVDVTGQVDGLATENFKAEQCGNEISTPLRWARVDVVGGNFAYTDSTGHFAIPAGSTPVTVQSMVKGHYFTVRDTAVADTTLSTTVLPPGPANFLHNPSNSDYRRAEVNAYLHANMVRDFALKYNPTYPGVYTQTGFPVYVNANYGYCPGNAWYTIGSPSLTFCRAGSGYPNTAFSTVVHHEYGHHLVQMAGSGQGQYGEGMGDVMGVLITNNPGLGWGFTGNCNTALRTADNTMQWQCTSDIHTCAQLLSGCVWSTRNELLISNPSDYLDILSALAVNAILLHQGTEITPQITIDYLTLDDDDGNIYNGTPHYPQICAGFGAHNMDCPALTPPITITHTPLGNQQSNLPYQVDAVITTTEGTIDTAKIYWSTGGSYNQVPMASVGGTSFRGFIPGQPNCTNVNYYIYAHDTYGNHRQSPETGFYSFFVNSSTAMDTLFVDRIENGTNGWTHAVVTPTYVDQWAIRTNHRYHSASNAWKFGNASYPGTYANLGDGGLVTPSIAVSAGAKATFWMWGYMEESSSTEAWDGAMVEISVNNGAFAQITPVGGYSHTILGGSNGPWATGTPCWSGSFGWTQKEIRLSSYAGSSIRLRFRFGSDESVRYEGWYIDDVLVTAPHCETLPNGAIAGNVTDPVGPVANVRVHAFDGSGHDGWDTTGADGAYSMTIPVSTYSVSFAQIDHRDTTIAGVVVTEGNTTTLNVMMQRLPGAVKGTVVSGPSSPIANVRVVAVGSGKEDTTGGNGAYIITGLADGIYSIAFSHIDYRDTTIASVSVTPGDTTTVNVTMKAIPGWIVGTVRDSTGAPIESVYVRINTGGMLLAGAGKQGVQKLSGVTVSSNGSDPPLLLAVDSVYTDATGYYSSYVAAGTYNVRFTKNDYRDTTVAGVAVTPNDTSTVSPTLRRFNHPPIITSPPTATATEDILFRYTATASDSDGVVPGISFSNYSGWMSVLGDTISGTPTQGMGNTSFRIIASDGYLADTQVVAVTVIPVNDPPQITSPDTATAVEHILFTYTATATDPDGPSLTINLAHYPSWLTRNGNALSGMLPEGAQDTSFMVTATDGLLADTLIVSLHVILVNDPPVITSPDTATALSRQPFSYTAMAFDPDGTTPVISFERYPAWMSVSGNEIHGIPLYASRDTSFVVIASDGEVADSLLVLVRVIPSCIYVVGDVNGSEDFNGIDIGYMVNYFKGGPEPTVRCDCPSYGMLFVQGDVNASCVFNGIDVSYGVVYLKGGPALMPCADCPPPGPAAIGGGNGTIPAVLPGAGTSHDQRESAGDR